MTEPLQFTMTHKIVGGCITAILVWTAYTTQQTSTQVAVLSAQVESGVDLRNRVNIMEKDQSTSFERMNSLAGRITALEQKLDNR